MPCAVSGRRNTVEASSFTGPIVVSNIRLNWRASVRVQSGCSPGHLDRARRQLRRRAAAAQLLAARCAGARLLEVVGAEAQLAGAAVDQGVGEALEVPGG